MIWPCKPHFGATSATRKRGGQKIPLVIPTSRDYQGCHAWGLLATLFPPHPRRRSFGIDSLPTLLPVFLAPAGVRAVQAVGGLAANDTGVQLFLGLSLFPSLPPQGPSSGIDGLSVLYSISLHSFLALRGFGALPMPFPVLLWSKFYPGSGWLRFISPGCHGLGSDGYNQPADLNLRHTQNSTSL